MRRRRLLVMLAAVMTLSPMLADASPEPQKGPRPVRFITFSSDAATVATQALGFFAAEGLAVDRTETPDSTAQMRGLSQGTWDIASTGFDNVLAWSGREDAEIVAVLQPNAGQMLPMYVRPEIKDWSDLRGKRLAADAVDTAFALVLRRILLEHGLDLDRGDYELVPEGTTALRLESMRRGDTYAGIMSVNLEAQAQAAGLVRWADNREVLPDYPGGVFAVTRAWAQGHRDEIVRFIRAWLAGNRWVQQNREAAIELVMAQSGINREAAVQRLAQVSPDGAPNVAGLQSVLDLRIQFGYTLPLGADLARFHDLSYYAQAVQASGPAR